MSWLPMVITAIAVAAAGVSARAGECPQGTTRQGAVPPTGRRVWCEDESGRRHGPMAAWYAKGELKVRGSYEHGAKSGKWLYFHADGLPRATGGFVAGRMHGMWTWWFADGRPSEEGEFFEGLERGPWVFWHDNGRVAQTGPMRDGIREGWWRFWAPDGSLEHMVLYEGGVEVDQRQQDSSRYSGYGGAYSCLGYGCGSWYRDCFAGFCDPYWDPYYRGYGHSYYGGYPVYRVYGPAPARPPQPAIPPSGVKPAKKTRKSVLPPAAGERERVPAQREFDPKPEKREGRRRP